MISKTVACPNCNTHVSCQGNPGDKITVICPNCGKKGIAIFASDKTGSKTSVNVIEVNNLSKYFGDVKANDSVNFSVEKGEIFGFLGPNGAGKTTAIKIIMALTYPSSGEVLINGTRISTDSVQIRKNIGYLPEQIGFYDNLTPLQTLHFFCELKGVEKSIAKSLLRDVGLEDAMHRKVGTFSKGMTQLLGVAQAMIGNPSIYILDEPMSGLDARWVKIIREKIKTLSEEGATILFSSHNLSEVQNLCNRVAIINNGRIIARDSIANLSSYLRIKPRIEISIPGLQGKVPEVIRHFEGVEAVDAKDDKLFVTCAASVRIQVVTALKDAGINIQGIKTIEPSLEEAFVKLISKGEGDA